MNYKMISHTLGWLLLFEAGFLAVPTLAAVAFREWSTMLSFFAAIGICLTVALPLWLLKPKSPTLRARDGFVIVSLSWIVLSLFGALPFLLSGAIPNFIDAFFETVSGFTTTGSSILADVEALPRSMLLWRSFTHWVGGMGVLVFLLAFLPLSGGQNMHIMKAESPGPSVSKLVPRVRTTAGLLYGIYFVLTAVMFLILLVGGMTPFEALCTAFGTAGTGGFSFYNSGMGGFSPLLQVIIAVFMLIFAINFESYFLVMRRKWREVLSLEVVVFLAIVAATVGLITWNLGASLGSVGDSLRHALFAVSSLISTTGFTTVDFDLWPAFSKALLLLLFFIGACAGSTGGGIKVSRIIILFKGVAREASRAVHPKQVKKISVNGHSVESETVRSVFSFFICFAIVFAFSFVILSLDGTDFATTFSAVASTLGNVGPGFGGVGPTQTYAFFSPLSKLVLCFNMLAGRLEILPMLLLFSPYTWKK